MFFIQAIAVDAPGKQCDWARRAYFSSVRTFWKAAVLYFHVVYIRLYMNDNTQIFFPSVLHETICRKHKNMLFSSIKNSRSFKLETNKIVSLTPNN